MIQIIKVLYLNNYVNNLNDVSENVMGEFDSWNWLDTIHLKEDLSLLMKV